MTLRYKTCANAKCREAIPIIGQPLAQPVLCPSCRYLARWCFAAGAFVAGAVWALMRAA